MISNCRVCYVLFTGVIVTLALTAIVAPLIIHFTNAAWHRQCVSYELRSASLVGNKRRCLGVFSHEAKQEKAVFVVKIFNATVATVILLAFAIACDAGEDPQSEKPDSATPVIGKC